MTKRKSPEPALAATLVPAPALVFEEQPRAVLGHVIIATDVNHIEEVSALIDNPGRFPGVRVQFARIPFPGGRELINAETYQAAYESGDIHAAFRAISLPTNMLTVQGVACTSLSFLLGEEKLRKAAIEDVPLTNMWSAVKEALGKVAARSKRIAVITPYIEEVHLENVRLLESQAGLRVVKSMYFGCKVDQETSALTKEFIGDCALQVVQGIEDDVDAVFLGCGGMRVCVDGFLDSLEKRLASGNIKVVTSTQAFCWHMLRSAGITDQIDGFGWLMKEC